jgi:hypothetical protein
MYALSSPPSGHADPARPNRHTILAAIAVALAAFALYHRTLLPGVDFGDSGSIQTVAGSALVTPRDGYPLYFALGDLILWLTRLDPARAMNLTSAIEGAAACGLFVVVSMEIVGSLFASVMCAILFMVSYTFWSQCVIAEVYALHLVFVLGTIFALLQWEHRPTTARLAVVFGWYALGFGNHLSMILLAPGIIAFLSLTEPGGWRRLLSPRVVALAIGVAALGSLQYLWNLRTLWFLPGPPASLFSALDRFWFDVTKSDWRNTMVLNVPRSMVADHAAMYWFDLRQQFGMLVPVLAAAGLLSLGRDQPRRALLLGLFYLANLAFAFGYNVGDAHVFYLPSHLILALAAAAGITGLATIGRLPRHRMVSTAAAVAVGAYAIARGYHDFPALDRSQDRRPTRWLRTFTAGLDERGQLLLVDLNWQAANGLSYYTSSLAPEVLVARIRDVLFYAPTLIRDNNDAGREVVLNAEADRLLKEAYGPLFDAVPDDPVVSLSQRASTAPQGTRYVLCVLKPTHDFSIDVVELKSTVRRLTGGSDVNLPLDRYAAMAGIVGTPPDLVISGERPFTRTIRLQGVPVEIRMDSWLNADTIRRMGFGHVVARRQHALIVERGISLTAFGDDGAPLIQVYGSNLFADQPRYLVRPDRTRAAAGMLR